MTLDIGNHDRSTEIKNSFRELLPYQRMAEIARSQKRRIRKGTTVSAHCHRRIFR